MSGTEPIIAPLVTIADIGVVNVGVRGPFVFDPGHRMRGCRCLGCQVAIGKFPFVVVSVVALTGDPCPTGCVPSDAYLLHATCLPADETKRAELIKRGITCSHPHPWQ